MKKRKKFLRRLLGVTAAALLLLQTVVICSAETSIEVTYNAADEGISVVLSTDRKEKVATVAVKQNGKYWVLAEFERTNKSIFTFACDLPADCPSGFYTVEVTIGDEIATDTFDHINKGLSAAAMAVINGANEQTFKTALEQTYGDLAVNYNTFLLHEDLLTELYYKYKKDGDLTSAEFSQHYAMCLALCELSAVSDNEAFKTMLAAEADKITFDYNSFSTLPAAEQAGVIGFFRNANYTEPTLSEQYEQWFCLAKINSLTDSGVATYEKALLTTYAGLLQLDTSDYEKSADKTEVIRLVMSNTYSSIADIRSAFNNAVRRVEESGGRDNGSVNNSSSSNRGSGGGGGGGLVGSTTQNNTGSTDKGTNQGNTGGEGQTETASLFTDVPANHWCAEQIKSFYQQGIVGGNGDGTFAPERPVTRAEFSKMLICALFGGETKDHADFADVPLTAWFNGYVGKASELGLVTGDGSGAFHPGDTISRQDMAVMLYRALQSLNLTFEAGDMAFADSELISEYARDAVAALSGNGILNGMENGSFEPKGNLNRAQAVKALYEALALIQSK